MFQEAVHVTEKALGSQGLLEASWIQNTKGWLICDLFAPCRVRWWECHKLFRLQRPTLRSSGLLFGVG